MNKKRTKKKKKKKKKKEKSSEYDPKLRLGEASVPEIWEVYSTLLLLLLPVRVPIFGSDFEKKISVYKKIPPQNMEI